MTAHTNVDAPKPITNKAWWDLLVLVLGITVVLVLGLVAVATLSLSPVGLASPAAQPAVQAPPAEVVNAAAIAPSSPPVALAPVNLISPTTSTNLDGGVGSDDFSPEVEDQGGTCISGTVIDIYHAPIGNGWTVTIQKIAPTQGNPITIPIAGNSFQIPSPQPPLDAGTYRVTLNFPDGWRGFTPTTFDVTLSGDTDDEGCATVRFKMEALANLIVTKYDEKTMLGVPNMVGLPGWEIIATNGTMVLTQTTDGQGNAYFTNLAPGWWIISEVPQDGWTPITPVNVSILLESPMMPNAFESVTFINKQNQLATLVVKKVDVFGIPLPNWHIFLTRDDGTHPGDDQYTNQLGEVYFLDLPLGNWTVTEALQAFWLPINGPTLKVKLEKPGEFKTVVFENEALGCIEGYKINDLEEPLEEWEIRAHSESGGDDKVAITDENGHFSFIVTLGAWTISETTQDGWTPVTPSSFSVNVTTPFAPCTQVRFKNRAEFACVDVYKRDDYDGVGLPGWLINIQPKYGTPSQSQSQVTDGTGWVRFTGLPPGEYKIWENLEPGWRPTSPAFGSVDRTLVASGTCSVVEFYNEQTNNTPPGYEPGWSVPSTSSGACSAYYTVKSGDTLYRIATHYGVTVSDLRAANKLGTSNLIHPNQRLCIP